MAMLSMCCRGLGGAGDVKLLPLSSATATSIVQEMEEWLGLLAGSGIVGKNASLMLDTETCLAEWDLGVKTLRKLPKALGLRRQGPYQCSHSIVEIHQFSQA